MTGMIITSGPKNKLLCISIIIRWRISPHQGCDYISIAGNAELLLCRDHEMNKLNIQRSTKYGWSVTPDQCTARNGRVYNEHTERTPEAGGVGKWEVVVPSLDANEVNDMLTVTATTGCSKLHCYIYDGWCIIYRAPYWWKHKQNLCL